MIEGSGAGYWPGSVLCTTVTDPGGPKTYGSYGFGSTTLLTTYLNSINWLGSGFGSRTTGRSSTHTDFENECVSK
jgi:hypothetical protein